jgi:hypothetical protein
VNVGHSQVMERQFIPKCRLIHGAYYSGTCRNASIARWNAIDQCFYHWRYKFGLKFVETIMAPEDDDTYDVFYAISVIEPQEEIPFEA